jgi:hypothetical protein
VCNAYSALSFCFGKGGIECPIAALRRAPPRDDERRSWYQSGWVVEAFER